MRDPQTCERTRKSSIDSPNNIKRETSIRKLKVKFFCDKTLVWNLGLHKCMKTGHQHCIYSCERKTI